MAHIDFTGNGAHPAVPRKTRKPAMTKFALSALALLSGALPALAGELPAAARSVSLGQVSGTAYSIRQGDALRVVATLSRTGDTAPVRVEAVLAEGQRVILSSPREAGAEAITVELVRSRRLPCLI